SSPVRNPSMMDRLVCASCGFWKRQNNRSSSIKKLRTPRFSDRIQRRRVSSVGCVEGSCVRLGPRRGSMRSSCSDRERVGMLPPIFPEELFKDTIARERKRTERSGLAMVMVLIDVQDSWHGNTPRLFAKMVDVLSAIKSDIDILGWFEGQSIIGLIVPEIDTQSLASTCERLESEFRKEITNQ